MKERLSHVVVLDELLNKRGWVSNYTVTQFKTHVPKCNKDKIENILDWKSHEQPKYHVVVSDLIYVRVGKTWNYIRVLVGLCCDMI